MTVRHEDLFHVGVVVDDFNAARIELARALGLDWLPDLEIDIPVALEGGDQTVRFRYAYSSEGPVRVELIQTVPGTLWMPSDRGQLHHFGYWAVDVAATSQSLATMGMPRIAAVELNGPKQPPSVVYHQAATGPYIEVVDVTMRPLVLGPDTDPVDRPNGLTGDGSQADVVGTDLNRVQA